MSVLVFLGLTNGLVFHLLAIQGSVFHPDQVPFYTNTPYLGSSGRPRRVVQYGAIVAYGHFLVGALVHCTQDEKIILNKFR